MVSRVCLFVFTWFWQYFRHIVTWQLNLWNRSDETQVPLLHQPLHRRYSFPWQEETPKSTSLPVYNDENSVVSYNHLLHPVNNRYCVIFYYYLQKNIIRVDDVFIVSASFVSLGVHVDSHINIMRFRTYLENESCKLLSFICSYSVHHSRIKCRINIISAWFSTWS